MNKISELYDAKILLTKIKARKFRTCITKKLVKKSKESALDKKFKMMAKLKVVKLQKYNEIYEYIHYLIERNEELICEKQ